MAARVAMRDLAVLPEERPARDFVTGDFVWLEHIWDETWHAPRGPIGAGVGVDAGRMMGGGGGASPFGGDRRRGPPGGGIPRGPGAGRAERSASTGGTGCDFKTLEAIWDAWWSVPGRAKPCAGAGDGGKVKEAGGGDRGLAGPTAVGRPAVVHHRRCRSYSGADFNRMAGPWPVWHVGVESIPGFDVSKLNGACLTAGKN